MLKNSYSYEHTFIIYYICIDLRSVCVCQSAIVILRTKTINVGKKGTKRKHANRDSYNYVLRAVQ